MRELGAERGKKPSRREAAGGFCPRRSESDRTPWPLRSVKIEKRGEVDGKEARSTREQAAKTQSGVDGFSARRAGKRRAQP